MCLKSDFIKSAVSYKIKLIYSEGAIDYIHKFPKTFAVFGKVVIPQVLHPFPSRTRQ